MTNSSDQIRAQLEAENRSLQEQINKINHEYKAKLDKLQSQQNQETKVLLDNLVKENEVNNQSYINK